MNMLDAVRAAQKRKPGDRAKFCQLLALPYALFLSCFVVRGI